jgi:capsular polysaccharide biosynthesis protein
VTYTDSDPDRTQRIANTAGQVLSERISDVSPGGSAVTATVWDAASLPDSPISPNPVRNILLALLVGLMIGVGLALLLDYLDDDWSSPEEVERISGVPTFAVVPSFKVRKIKKGVSR